jgi:hypothetical protein
MLTLLVALAFAADPPRPAGPPPTGRAEKTVRAVQINGRALTAAQLRTLEQLERTYGRLNDGAYWYDARTGASGRWGGPTLAFLPAGLDLAGPLPAEASGGGSGQLTGVFVNGRELHPLDVAMMQQLVGQVWPGRWWVDAQGYFGLEGGPPVGNLVALAQSRRQSGGGSKAWSKHYEGTTPGQNMNLASDGTTTCVSTAGYSHCTGE